MCTFADLIPGSKRAKKRRVVKQVTVECTPCFAQITLSAIQYCAALCTLCDAKINESALLAWPGLQSTMQYCNTVHSNALTL